MAFKKVSYPRFHKRSSLIAEQIVDKIRNGEYSVGSKLPPERVIAEKAGVSRPSVREAISALQIAGIVQSRPGDGTYVCASLASNDLMLQAIAVLEQSDSPLEMLQARKAMEIGVARLAITQGNDADIQKIQDIWKKKYEKGRKGEYGEYLKYAKGFHLSIARATKNSIIEKMMGKLLNVTQQPLWINIRRKFYEEESSRIEEVLEIHNKIVEAIKERNTKKAIVALDVHFDLLIKQIYWGANENTDDT